MPRTNFTKLDLSRLPTPCYVVDECVVEQNLSILRRVGEKSGARFLLALKAFSLWRLAPLVGENLAGVAASSVHEARLAAEEYGGEIHVYSPAYNQRDLEIILPLADNVVFNSPSQWERYRETCRHAVMSRPQLKFGLRINPDHSEAETRLYDPCMPGSRLGTTAEALSGHSLDGISGLHFHTLSEQGVDPFRRTLEVVEQKFAHILATVEWVNFGGGHLVTGEDYATEELVELIMQFSNRHDVQVYLEPGAAVAWDAGVLVTEVRDIANNQGPQVIVDCSPSCHMPDVLEMPYRPEVLGAGLPAEKAYDCRIGGLTCLAGDILGDYSFPAPLSVGDRLVLTDMAHYTMVRTSTFNGLPLPAIAIWNSITDKLEIIREFGYEDFKYRLS